MEDYREAEGWKEFSNIYAISGTPTNIKTLGTQVSISANGGLLTISGLTDGEKVSFYSASGMPLGTTVVAGGAASLSTSATGIVIVKIGNQSIKIAVE